MATARARATRKLKPWLVEQIESGKYHGLMWDDDLKTCFRIPWKHAGKQDFRHDEDAAIFKAWAMYKQKFQDGQKVNAAVWKTRLRCALNKSLEFQELPGRSQLDISEPYKVYRIVPPEEQSIASSEKQIRKRKVTVDSRSSSSDETGPVEKKPDIVTLQACEISEVTSSVSQEDSGIGSDLSNTDTPILAQHISELESSYPNTNITSMTPILPIDVPSHETHKDTGLRITVIYSGIEVAHKVVHCGECRLSAGPPVKSFIGGMEHVLLPAPGEQFQADIRKRTEVLLGFLQYGVMLASNADGIFAQRQKSCLGRIYWTGPYSSSPEVINKLERDDFVQLFDTKKFLRDLETYKTEGGTPPDYHVTLCFGEEISESSHTTDKLITAKIEQILASEMVHQAAESLCNVQFMDSLMQNSSPTYLITLLPVTTLDSIPEYS
ncbi:interferon regulatory factor 9 isoform X1 [Bufo bufo]|uniref:interferon regulatory factor 9 isoform X1 n=1 Tax=Bufo bufo TaxID=8384 RepID=UPI001ABE7DED|nr:interferon regulatory factor 9 isoform X1 [Bufo bufo]XP_040272854.1 interferon regulatory factor 9 isoform X1 [Bufo bufo]